MSATVHPNIASGGANEHTFRRLVRRGRFTGATSARLTNDGTLNLDNQNKGGKFLAKLAVPTGVLSTGNTDS